jgi:hypothetical protein
MAVTVTLEFIVTVQVPVPGQEPAKAGETDHPVKVAPAFGIGVNFTMRPTTYLRQPLPQFTGRPAMLGFTEPFP